MASAEKADDRIARRHLPRAVLVACGSTLFVWLVVQIGPQAVLASFERLSWRLLVLLVFPCVLFKTFDTLGWYFAFGARPTDLLTLAKTRLVGQAINATTPTGTLGGDAAKVWLLRGAVSVPESLSSLVIVKTTMTVSQGLFLLVGVLIARRQVAADAALLAGMEWLLALEVVAVCGFVMVQMTGAFGTGHRLLCRVGLLGRAGLRDAVDEIDLALSNFYRQRPGRLALSVGFNLLGWFGSAAETWMILVFLGAPVSATTALVIEAFGTGIRFATFFVPAQVGFLEGGTVATFLALGLSGATGLSLSLVRRVREVVWIGIGFLLAGTSARPEVAFHPSGA
jgi:glycosyltransferase 2 family protein